MAISETSPTTAAAMVVAAASAVEGTERPVPLRAEPIAGPGTPRGLL
ncbi:hypothetical protein RM550_09055 [Streptomyces sp. DSM 41527]|uniref:Uncharacterized protein n=1 Tax=Streptomyces mooreae TaxID=3075523 RepID=A0ABU2T6B3_9ACTN|nr:hypothetical protein [Streptomyces sp. DSM 41527]MDT0455885.1 hypothetical protein [Streptomyces sp. DSM 41527]